MVSDEVFAMELWVMLGGEKVIMLEDEIRKQASSYEGELL